jgi:hypothetical protein
MNRIPHNFDPKLKREPLAPFINDRFVNHRYWQRPVADRSHLEDSCGFNATTVYMEHASRLPAPVSVASKTWVNFKNDGESSMEAISLVAVELDEEVFTLQDLPQGKSVRLEFVRKGRYSLRYGWTESGQRKEASVAIVVR